jgi:hypothetical protein
MPFAIDHVALLVEDLELAVSHAQVFNLPVDAIQEFPGEGTREAYVGGPQQSAKLLLMQPMGNIGPYARALSKRGPGLHHIAIAAPHFKNCAELLPGWLLHPASLHDNGGTLWFARPGVPTLLEVTNGDVTPNQPVVESIQLPVAEDLERLLAPLLQVKASPDDEIWLTLKGQRVPLSRFQQGRIQ